MSADRINAIITLDKAKITELMSYFNPEIQVKDFSLMNESMGNTGYKVTTDTGIYLLKLYSTKRDGIECAMYGFLEDKISVPKLYYYDNSKSKVPFVYCIIEFINSVTLAEYLRSSHFFPSKLAFDIGSMCASIHKKSYPHDALLNEKLKMTRRLPTTFKKILYMLGSKPAMYLKPETARKLSNFIFKNRKLFKRLDSEAVLCQGDFHFWNILISGEKAYCIDFEYAYAGSRYNDIGHFFRRRSEDIQSTIDERVYDAFADGYNSVSDVKLPTDWLRLARLCDINAMLCLFNNDSFPNDWIADIEADILAAVDSENT